MGKFDLTNVINVIALSHLIFLFGQIMASQEDSSDKNFLEIVIMKYFNWTPHPIFLRLQNMLASNNQVYNASDVHLKSTLKLSALKIQGFFVLQKQKMSSIKNGGSSKIKEPLNLMLITVEYIESIYHCVNVMMWEIFVQVILYEIFV